MGGSGLVDKATSDLLIGPDWAMNMEICDIINNDPGQAKDVVKAVKKRLAHRNPKVQLLALTFLETIVKNCGVAVHQQVAEKDVLHEMVKIIKRKTDMHVRDKILVLLNSWKDAFGGPHGRYPQFYMAYAELRGMGVEFPETPGEHDAPIFTPPQTHPIQRTGYGSPAHIPSRLEALMNNEQPGLSLTEIETARGRSEVLLEMLNALNPPSRQSVKDELIVELVDQCRSTQTRVMHLVNNTSDEELLRQGLALNDDLQRVLEKHDAIASGTPLSKEPAPSSAVAQPTSSNSPPKPTKEPEDLLTTRQASAAAAESSDPFIQLALTAPPTPSTPANTGQKSSSQSTADFIDLLSGDAAPSNPPTPSAPPVALNNQSVSNPFVGEQAFQAAPSSFATPQPHSPQQQQNPQAANGTFATANGSLYNGTAQHQQPEQLQQQQHQQQQQQQQDGFSFPQYQGGYSAAHNSYIAPWAMPNTGGQLSPQQQAMIYGGNVQGNQFPSQPTPAPWQQQQVQAQQQYSAGQQQYSAGQQQQYSAEQQQQYPAGTGQQQQYPAGQQYTGGYYGYSPYGQHYYSDQYSYQYGADAYYQQLAQQQQMNGQSLALVPVTSGVGSSSSGGGSSSSNKPTNPTDKLFEDLVDMQGLNSKFKNAGISGSLSRPGKTTGSL